MAVDVLVAVGAVVEVDVGVGVVVFVAVGVVLRWVYSYRWVCS